jgi:hypothetical protein
MRMKGRGVGARYAVNDSEELFVAIRNQCYLP